MRKPRWGCAARWWGAVLVLAGVWRAPQAAAENYRTWQVYGGTPDALHYSKLRQINRGNVRQLRQAWRYESGDAFPGSEMECNPVCVGGVLYATTPSLRLIALDAANGTLIWSFHPPEEQHRGKVRNRGVTVWGAGGDRRVFLVVGHNLYAVSAATGQGIPSFGHAGRVDLRDGLGRDPEGLSVTATSPGVIYQDLLILGSALPEDLPSPPGDIRAYDVRTGQVRWTFHTIPHPGEFGYDTWPPAAWKYSGGANNWAGMSVDEKRGLVFVPTGSAAFDFYGADRLGDDLFADCLLALNARTGKLVWHFQGVRHDLWDRDFPAPPTLVTLQRAGRRVDAVAQITKAGYVFVFERESGQPLFPIDDRPVPASDLEGEQTAPTQPVPRWPKPFADQEFTPDMVTDRTPAAHADVLARLRKLRYGGQFIPGSREGTVIFPGFDGGGEWGGPAFDPSTGLLYVNANVMAWVLRLVPRPQTTGWVSVRQLYLTDCATCHKPDLSGSPPQFPSLRNLRAKYEVARIAQLIRKGGARMPAFNFLGDETLQALAQYVATGKEARVTATWNEAELGPWLRYRSDGYNQFLDPDGYPAVKPPWGTLSAIDLNTGHLRWRIPFGEFPALVRQGVRNTGSENYGGPLVTAGGLLFIAATDHDNKLHAYDKANGRLLWEATLPAAGNATPATFQLKGRQYVVIAAGGGKSGEPSGGSYVAFALPP